MITNNEKKTISKAMIRKLFQEKYNRQKRPILHKLFSQCPELIVLNNISKSTARKVFCEFFEVEIDLVQFHLMQKPMTKQQLRKFNYTIDIAVIEELVTKHLK